MATLIGTNSNNTLTGTSSADTMVGRSGNDQLLGNGGNDRLNGGTQNDVLNGGAGIDTADYSNLVIGSTTYIGSAAFTAAGQLRYTGGILQGSTDADTAAEFEIQLVGSPALTVGGAGTDILL